eukprot:scaffold885_cov209-Skeletonema_marinoi.AAC.3
MFWFFRLFVMRLYATTCSHTSIVLLLSPHFLSTPKIHLCEGVVCDGDFCCCYHSATFSNVASTAGEDTTFTTDDYEDKPSVCSSDLMNLPIEKMLPRTRNDTTSTIATTATDTTGEEATATTAVATTADEQRSSNTPKILLCEGVVCDGDFCCCYYTATFVEDTTISTVAAGECALGGFPQAYYEEDSASLQDCGASSSSRSAYEDDDEDDGFSEAYYEEDSASLQDCGASSSSSAYENDYEDDGFSEAYYEEDSASLQDCGASSSSSAYEDDDEDDEGGMKDDGSASLQDCGVSSSSSAYEDDDDDKTTSFQDYGLPSVSSKEAATGYQKLMNIPIKKKSLRTTNDNTSLISTIQTEQVDVLVVVRNILYEATEGDLIRLINEQGLHPRKCDLVMNKGFAFVTFPTFPEAVHACNVLDKVSFLGRQLNVVMSDKNHRYSLTSTTSLPPEDYSAMNATGQAESIFGGANFANMQCTEDDCGDNCRHPSDDIGPSERADIEDRYERRPRFTPTRSSDPPDDWESIYGITSSELEGLRAKALKNLEPFRKDCPDLVYYLSELIKIVVPGDRMFFILLHCAVQMSRGLINANCGGSHAFGEDIDLASLGNCSLEALNALSEYFEPFSTINMGSIAKAIGALNGRQDLCPTTTRKFSPCDPLAAKDPLPDKVLDVLRIVFGHFEAVKANALMFSAAGTTTNVNERILLKLAPSFDDSEHVSIPEILMNHIQFFRRAFHKSSLVDTYTKMSANFQRLSECISSHLVDKCDVIPAKSLFDHGCDSNDLPMIGRDPNATEASLEMLVGSAGHCRRDAIKTYCISHPESPASKGPSVVRGYALANLEDILKRQREYQEDGRVDFIPETFEDVLCWHILSNMSTNRWDKLSKQEKNEWVNAMKVGLREKSRKRERGETDVSDDVSGDVRGGKIRRMRKKKCSVPNCPNRVVQGEICVTHGAKKKKYTCSVPDCPNRVVLGGVCVTHGAQKKQSKATKKKKECIVPNCPRKAVQGGVCVTHGAKVKTCSVPDCPNQVRQGGVCIAHGAKVKVKKKRACIVPNCPRKAVQGGVCVTHGAKVKTCSKPNCPKKAIQGGVCIAHGAKVKKRKTCSVPNCPKLSQRGGVCVTHGAKTTRCSVPKCSRQALQGGVCVTHGAKVTAKTCSAPNCSNLARKGGVCITHGAKKI